jgi:Rps23 Pro-64 3,4-dihydroxylase Tpa1-like proline 4-hydroxylase
MDKIQLYDHFLMEGDIQKCVEFTKQAKWAFGHTSNGNNIGTPFWYMNLYDNVFFSTYLKEWIEKKTGRKFQVNRVYANGHTFGQGGSFHQDDVTPNTYTLCLYINPISKDMSDEVGGYIQFKIPDPKFEDFIIDIAPLYNRAVIFPSHYFHRGNSFSRYVNDLRISIAWKLKEI